MEANKAITKLNIKVYHLVLDALQNNNDITEEIRKEFGNGYSADQNFFGKTFAFRSGNVAARLIAEDLNSLTEITSRLHNYIKLLNGPQFALAVDIFLKSLIELIPEFVTGNNQIKPEIQKQIVEATQLRVVMPRLNSIDQTH